MEAKVSHAGKPGARERLKRDTRVRIVLAARKLFSEFGYDGATMRQIASEAGLVLGTLSNYVSVKRDLIYLIFNDEMDALTTAALAAPRPAQSFVEKMLVITECHFRMFARDPILSRILLSEILQHTPGLHLEQYLRIRGRLLEGMEAFVVEAQTSGEIECDEKADLIALNIFFVLSNAARWFLASPEPDWREGVSLCERMFQVSMNGLSRKRPEKSTGQERVGSLSE